MKLAAVPPAEWQGIREQLAKVRPDAIQRTVDEGRVIYEVEIKRGSGTQALRVSLAGKVL